MREFMKTLCVFFFSLLLLSGMDAKAAVTTCTTYSGSNVEAQNYSRSASPVYSYLVPGDDDTLMRVQYGSGIGGVLIEYYDASYNLIEEKSRILPQELPLFGGFYETDKYYFLLTGQNNSEESPDVEVYRVTKYDKSWKRLGAAGLYDCNTTVPFRSGSARMDWDGNYLLIRTSHTMYKSQDGLNHQANVTIQVDMETMTVTDSYTGVMNNSYGYVSHSFNQFIKVENNQIIAVDHGDAYPRSIVLLKYQTDISSGKFTPTYGKFCEAVNVLEFPGKIGENSTGAAVGGFEISDTSYLVAGHSVVQDADNLTRKTRNVFVAAVDKSTSEVKLNWLTSYEEGDATTSTPQMVKIAENRYMLLWSRDNTVYYTQVDGRGEQQGSVYQSPGSLSDCVPVLSDGKVIWYTWSGSVITFYDIPLDRLDQMNTTEIVNGHDFENAGVTEGTATLICKKCGEEKQVAVATSVTCWWNEDGGSSYHSYFPSQKEMEERIYYWIQYSPSGADGEMEVVSSDESIVSVSRQNSARGYLTMKKAGMVTITVRPKLNPEASRSFTLTVYGHLNVDAFTAAPASAQYIESEIILSAQASGGRESYQYQFSVEEEDGTTAVIQEYASSNTCIWIPQTAGRKALHVQIKDAKGNVAEKTISDYEVKKWPSPELGNLVKTYHYTVGAAHEEIDISRYLPQSLKDAEYSAAAVDFCGILDQVSIGDDGRMTYQVKDTGAKGDTAEIHVTVSSANYEDIILKVLIQLTDKSVVTQKEGYPVTISGSHQLIYGQRLRILQLSADAVFVAADGTEVQGSLSWREPESIPAVGTAQAEWIFTPTDEASYMECRGSLAIEVMKNTPDVTIPSVDGFVYDPSRKLADVELKGENGTAIWGESTAEVPGIWSFEEPDTVPCAGRQSYAAVFTPEDVQNYNSVETMVTVEVAKATPQITELPAIGQITYGVSLQDAQIQGGTAVIGDTPVDGSFSFRDGQTKPAVKDSGVTGYELIFQPEDTQNYLAVSCGAVTVTVQPAELTAPRPQSSMTVEYGVDTVSQISLPDGWSWKAEDAGKKLSAGTAAKATAVYWDMENYRNASVEITITREPCVNHQYTSAVTKAPTASSEGVRTYTCGICGAVRTEAIPKLTQTEPTPKPDQTEPSPKPVQTVKKNLTATVGALKFKVTKAGASGIAQVSVVSVKNKKVTTIVIPKTVQIQGVTCQVTGIGAKAFYHCKKLKKITIQTTALKKIGKNAIKGIHKKAVIKVPKSKLALYKKKFNKKSGYQKTMKVKK